MNNLKTFFTTASGIFAVIPGLTILLTNVGVPPHSSRYLFAGVVEALGVLTLLILSLNKKRIRSFTNSEITKLCLFSTLIFLISLFTYLFIYWYLLVPVANSKPVFFPLWAEGELKEGLQLAGSKPALIERWGRDDVYKVIQQSSSTSLLITTLILLFLYQLIFVALTFSFGILGIKNAEAE